MHSLPVTIASNQFPWRTVTHRELLDQFLSRRSVRTRKAYESDLSNFAFYCCATDIRDAVSMLLGLSPGQANTLALQYKNWMIEKKLSPATINRRLAALRSVMKLANTLGLVQHTLSIENERTRGYRDTRGTGEDGYRAILEEARKHRNRRKAVRDTVLLRLLYDLGLRRGEVAALNIEDVDLGTGMIMVTGKGCAEASPITLPDPTKEALAEWIEMRGESEGPLFTNLDNAHKGSRLTGSAIYAIVRKLGQRVGVKARPHGLRHAAITTAAEITKGNVVAIRRFSRHRNVQTVMVYVDNYKDEGGEIAKQLAGRVQ